RARSLGWTIGAAVEKNEGFHRVLSAVDPNGKPGYVIQRVNGDDRVIHIQSLLKLAGAPEENVQTVGRTHSWRADYLKAFQRIGHKPDHVVYGFANTLVDTVLLRNRSEN